MAFLSPAFKKHITALDTKTRVFSGKALFINLAIWVCKTTLPDILLMDINMPIMNGIIAARHIRERYLSVKIIIVTMSDDETNLFEAIKAGAPGYFLKDRHADQLHSLLVSIFKGETTFSGVIATKILNEFRQWGNKFGFEEKPTKKLDELSTRQNEIISLLANGLGNQEIAQKLFLSESTVKKRSQLDYGKIAVE